MQSCEEAFRFYRSLRQKPNIGSEIPVPLKAVNCLTYADHGPIRIAAALLECVGLLPRQRRVFLSYRRDEARDAAL